MDHLNSLGGQLKETSSDGHRPGVLGVQRGQESRRLAVEVLLVVDEALGEERDVTLVEIIRHGTLSTVLLHKGHTELLALDDVQHLFMVVEGIRRSLR